MLVSSGYGWVSRESSRWLFSGKLSSWYSVLSTDLSSKQGFFPCKYLRRWLGFLHTKSQLIQNNLWFWFLCNFLLNYKTRPVFMFNLDNSFLLLNSVLGSNASISLIWLKRTAGVPGRPSSLSIRSRRGTILRASVNHHIRLSSRCAIHSRSCRLHFLLSQHQLLLLSIGERFSFLQWVLMHIALIYLRLDRGSILVFDSMPTSERRFLLCINQLWLLNLRV